MPNPSPRFHPGGSTHHLAGSKHPLSKLTEEDVRDIRRWLAEGVKHSAIARRKGVTRGTVADIKAGKSWAWLV